MTEDSPRETLYTLPEARQLIAIDNCRVFGHDWVEVRSGDGKVISMNCVRPCGTTATVNEPDMPKGR